MDAGTKVYVMSDGSKIRMSGGTYKMVYAPLELTIAKARKNYRCPACKSIISKGDLHGSSYVYHWCLDCVMTDRPEPRIEEVN